MRVFLKAQTYSKEDGVCVYVVGDCFAKSFFVFIED